MSWNLIGHEWAENLLKEHILHNEVRHAYLFTGANGTGRRSLALEFACAVNCLQPPAPGEYCGKCRMCLQLQKMQQADLSVVKAETDGGMIKVEQVRNLERSLSLSPYEAKYRIALLLDFQQANANSQNALLKTLEEAPRQVILLLTADSAENLLPTIASRCEILRLRPISVDHLEAELKSRWNLDTKRASLFAHMANGRVGKAVQFTDQPEFLENRKALLDDLARLLTSSRRERFTYTETLARNRDGVRLALQTWFTYVRDLLLLVNGSDSEITNLDRKEELIDLTGKLDGATVLQMVNAVDQALAALESNGHLRLLLDTFFLDLPRID
jgi:DNA polymerase-3 subunit delta'